MFRRSHYFFYKCAYWRNWNLVISMHDGTRTERSVTPVNADDDSSWKNMEYWTRIRVHSTPFDHDDILAINLPESVVAQIEQYMGKGWLESICQA